MDMKNLFSLEGKVALVTGAAYGIGFAIAEAYAKAGAKIAFNCRGEKHMEEAMKAYAEKGIDSGIDPMGLPEIMDLDLFMPTDYAFKDLGVTEDDIKAAITDSIKVSVASYEGKVKLLEMKGE